MPSIPAWLDEAGDVTDEIVKQIISILFDALGREEATAKLIGAMPSSRKRKKRKKAEAMQPQQPADKRATNLFSLLTAASTE
jgi:hypothetical protein